MKSKKDYLCTNFSLSSIDYIVTLYQAYLGSEQNWFVWGWNSLIEFVNCYYN